MEIDVQAINTNTLTAVSRTKPASPKSDETSKVKARSEEVVKQQQEAKENAIKQLEQEVQLAEKQRERIDAEKYLRDIINITEIFNRKLKFSIDKELDQVIVKVVDAETDKVIKEIPPEELKRLYAKMKEAMGLIIDTTI